MKLSVPVYVLKKQAKALAKRDGVRLHVALDRVAVAEGFQAWSHLAASAPTSDPSAAVLDRLVPGDLVLVAARPGQGKTLFAAGLVAEALARGRHAAFFTLAVAAAEVERYLERTGRPLGAARERLLVDDGDGVTADHVAARLADAAPGTLVAIDYLQLLDQRRDQPPLDAQVAALARFAAAHGAVVVVLAQVRRDYRPDVKPFPDLGDVRLPNPVDLSAFTKACFLEGGRVHLVETPPRAGA